MNGDPLLSCRIKIDRAIKHFNDLIAEVEAYRDRDPNKIILDEDSEPAIKIYKIGIKEPMPETWSAIIGDTIHNLRSAMDCLAVALVVRAGITDPGIIQDTYFPISWDNVGLSGAKRLLFFQRVGPAAEKIIRRLQPYRGGKGHPLWQLNQLDIIDKHRRIIPAGAALSKVEFFIERHDAPASVYKAQPAFPLKEGDELFRAVFFEAHFDANSHFTFDVAFNETGIVEREPVLPTLSEFINFVQRVIMIFEKRFS